MYSYYRLHVFYCCSGRKWNKNPPQYNVIPGSHYSRDEQTMDHDQATQTIGNTEEQTGSRYTRDEQSKQPMNTIQSSVKNTARIRTALGRTKFSWFHRVCNQWKHRFIGRYRSCNCIKDPRPSAFFSNVTCLRWKTIDITFSHIQLSWCQWRWGHFSLKISLICSESCLVSNSTWCILVHFRLLTLLL